MDKFAVADALVKFGEDIEEEMFLFVNAQQYAEIRKDEAFMHVANGEVMVKGHVGQIYGVQVVVSNRVGAKEAFIVKRGALALIMKRNVQVETDRDILAKTNVIACDEHYAVYLKNDAKAIKIQIA